MAKKRTIEIPKFIRIEPGIASNIKKILHNYRLDKMRTVLLTGPEGGRTFELAHRTLEKGLVKNVLSVEIDPRLKCRNSVYNVKKLSLSPLLKDAEMLIGFGGCGVLDVVKHLAFVKEIDYLLVPTTVSNDGIASPISVIINSKEISVSHFTKSPLGVFLDLDLLTNCPKEMILSGIGDLITNISAVRDWELAQEEEKEKVDDFAKMISLASTCYLYEHIEVLTENPDFIFNAHFIERLVRGLVMSGLAMAVHGTSRPCSGSEHKFYHSLNKIYKKRAIPHGIQVAIGMVYAEYLRKADYLKYIKLFKSLGIPVSSGQIAKAYGLKKDKLVEALAKSVYVRKGERYTIFENKNLNSRKARSVVNDVDRIVSFI